MEKEFNWLKKTRRILFTGLSKERFFIKGAYFHLPLIKIEPLEDYEEFDNYLKNGDLKDNLLTENTSLQEKQKSTYFH